MALLPTRQPIAFSRQNKTGRYLRPARDNKKHSIVEDIIATFHTRLLQAFPVDYPEDLQITKHGCDECEQVANDFLGQRWDLLPRTVLDNNFDKLPLFTLEALQYFLPAYLRAALAEPESDVAEFLSYMLAPSGLPAKFIPHFTTAQRRMVVEYLDLTASDPEFQDKTWHKTRRRWLPNE